MIGAVDDAGGNANGARKLRPPPPLLAPPLPLDAPTTKFVVVAIVGTDKFVEEGNFVDSCATFS